MKIPLIGLASDLYDLYDEIRINTNTIFKHREIHFEMQFNHRG